MVFDPIDDHVLNNNVLNNPCIKNLCVHIHDPQLNKHIFFIGMATFTESYSFMGMIALPGPCFFIGVATIMPPDPICP